MTNFLNYIYSFFIGDEHALFYENYKSTPKPFFQYNFLDDIDFDNTPTSDIVIKLNYMKHKFFFDNNCNKIYDKIYIDNKNKVNKLKFVLLSCLQTKNDTTDIMIKHIRKYKGEKIILSTIVEDDIEYKKLERRYNKLLEDNEDDEDDDNTDGMTGLKITNKKKVSLLS